MGADMEIKLHGIRSNTKGKTYGTNEWCLGFLQGLAGDYSKEPRGCGPQGWLIPEHSWAVRWPENNYHFVTVKQSLLAPWGVGFED